MLKVPPGLRFVLPVVVLASGVTTSLCAGEYVVPADRPARTDALIVAMRRFDATAAAEPRLVWLPDDSRALEVRPGNPEMLLLDPASGRADVIPETGGRSGVPEFLCAAEGRFLFYVSGGWECVDPATRTRRPADAGEVREAEAHWNIRGGGTRKFSSPHAPLLVRNGTKTPVTLAWKKGSGKPVVYATIAPGKEHLQSTFSGHEWEVRGAGDDVLADFKVPVGGGIVVLPVGADVGKEREAERRHEKRNTSSHPSDFHVKDGALIVTRPVGGDVVIPARLSPGENLTDPAPSKDGAFAVAFALTKPPVRMLTYVEARPPGSDKPRVFSIPYPKPGDAIDSRRPVLFDAKAGREIPADAALFADVWTFEPLGWSADDAEFLVYLHYRTHKISRFVAISRNGSVRTVIEEKSDTFIDYSQKGWYRVIAGGRELLWASERDGRNHIYRFDLKTGALLNQVTKGDFIVRSVDNVDEKSGTLECTVLAARAGEDPYYRNLLRCRIDGTGTPVVPTSGDGDHSWEFSPGRRYLTDRWSRVDMPPAAVLRDASTGRMVRELVAPGATAIPADYPVPERFVAKGRDGKTDIYGVIYRPPGLKPGDRIPVIESIYAGPHGFNVPKRWGTNEGAVRRAGEGYAVVIIDGMGTNWRDRAFHDVCYKNIRDAGFPDRIAWMKAAAAKHPELDISRVGIIGGSAGGQNAVGAVIFHGDFYKAAVGDCGCHDNRIDKTWWNEAWMGWPVGPEYADNSNIVHAAELKGRVLLLVGELDTNVDPACTYDLAKAFEAAGKPYSLHVVPGGGHCVSTNPAVAGLVSDFFAKTLRNR